ncbi:hypothetical protein BDN70DRAFT_924641, partial [Pholiota conissans]
MDPSLHGTWIPEPFTTSANDDDDDKQRQSTHPSIHPHHSVVLVAITATLTFLARPILLLPSFLCRLITALSSSCTIHEDGRLSVWHTAATECLLFNELSVELRGRRTQEQLSGGVGRRWWWWWWDVHRMKEDGRAPLGRDGGIHESGARERGGKTERRREIIVERTLGRAPSSSSFTSQYIPTVESPSVLDRLVIPSLPVRAFAFPSHQSIISSYPIPLH